MKKWRFLALAVASLIGVFAYWTTVPTQRLGQAQADIVGSASEAGKYGARPLRLSARLDSGLIATFTLPKGKPLRPRARVVLEVRRQERWPYAISYRFVSYAEDKEASP